MVRYCAISLVGILLGCHEKAKLPEGIYTMAQEVAGYSSETIELKGGKFRYWFSSDLKMAGEPVYPLTGTYSISGNFLCLDHAQIHSPVRAIGIVNGVSVLWRNDGLSLWNKEKRIQPYAVLLRVEGATDGSKVAERPSLELLKTAELKDRDKKENDDRYNDQPAEARVLLRGRSTRGDGNMDTYKGAIASARVQPDPKLLQQLVTLLSGDEDDSINAISILEDLFLETWLIKEPPPFLKNPLSKKRALEDLIDALSKARDRNALEKTMILFLRVSGAAKIDLAIPETGIRIILETGPNGGGRYASEGTRVDDVDWMKVISKLIPPCQKWMRAQPAK